MLELLAHKLAGLGAGRFALAGVLSCAINRRFFWHEEPPPVKLEQSGFLARGASSRREIGIESAGFKRASRPGVDVVVNTTERVDLTLEPGQLTETVEVAAATPILQTERADTGRNVETKSIEDLPIGTSHNFQSLSILVPGSTRVESQHSAFFNPQTSYATRFNGQSRLGNNLQLEGIDDNERTGLLQVLIPPQEAIQTVDISTSDYDAELGRATGGAINVILKSGSNQFHGEAYEFNRISDLSTRNFFDAARGHFTYNYFGW
jgi:hypothetical protein